MLYKHPNCRDAAFEIEKRFYVPEKNIWKLKVLWWNIGACHDPWPMGISQRIELTDEELLMFKPFAGRCPPPQPKYY